MNTVKNLLLALFLIQPLTACAFTDGPFEGQVLDYDTGKPIPGAIAVALWKSSTLDSGQGVCVHAETAVSGADGKYHIPRWWQAPPVLILSAARMLDVYKEGYENVGPAVYYQGLEVDKWVVYRHKEVIGTFADKASAKEASHPNDVYLKAFGGTSSERFEYLRYRVFSGTSCTSAGAS